MSSDQPGSDRFTVSESALATRINRRLARRGEVLKRSRGERVHSELGKFHVLDIARNRLVEMRVDLEELARRLGVLHPGEMPEGSRPDDRPLSRDELRTVLRRRLISHASRPPLRCLCGDVIRVTLQPRRKGHHLVCGGCGGYLQVGLCGSKDPKDQERFISKVIQQMSSKMGPGAMAKKLMSAPPTEKRQDR